MALARLSLTNDEVARIVLAIQFTIQRVSCEIPSEARTDALEGFERLLRKFSDAYRETPEVQRALKMASGGRLIVPGGTA